MLNSEVGLKDLFTSKQDIILKNIIWELGGEDLGIEKDSHACRINDYQREDFMIAIKRGALIWIQDENYSGTRNNKP